MQEASEGKVIEVPDFSASTLNISIAGTEALLLFSGFRPAVVVTNGQEAPGVMVQPRVSVTVSVLTLKEMSLAIGEAIDQYEAQVGPLETEFTRQRAAHKRD